jgi:hypothetical protein
MCQEYGVLSWRRQDPGRLYRVVLLDHVEAKQKYLILKGREFFDCFTRETAGRLAKGLALGHCELPKELCREIAAIRTKSRSELGFDEST